VTTAGGPEKPAARHRRRPAAKRANRDLRLPLGFR
jgi:hypothetical protein